MEAYLQEACALLEDRGVIQAKEVAHALLEREKIGGVGIPGTKLALYHTRSKYVHKPSFTVHKMESAVWIKGMDGNDIKVDTILLLLSPEPFGKAGLEILSFISTLTIQDEQSTQMFETGNQSQVHSFLATELEQFITENIN